jgi:hypothetical protein
MTNADRLRAVQYLEPLSGHEWIHTIATAVVSLPKQKAVVLGLVVQSFPL